MGWGRQSGLRLRVVASVMSVVFASCANAGAPSPREVATPTVDVQNPCDYICLATLDTAIGRFAVGTAWDEGARLKDGYLAVWLVRDGTSTRTKLTGEGVGDVGVPVIVRWGNGAAIIATGLGAGGALLSWTTADGMTWLGPTAFVLPGDSPIPRLVASWRSHMLILGEQLLGDEQVGYRYLASVWTSVDGAAWKLAPRPDEFDDASVTRWWEGEDGLVVGIAPTTAGVGVPQEQAWTTTDFTNWRPAGSPRPCVWKMLSNPARSECQPLAAATPPG